MKRKWLSVLLAALLVFAIGTAAVAETVKTSTADGSLNVRSGPGKEYSVLGWVKNGETITVVESGSDWVKIRVARSGIVGYIRNQYIVYDSWGSSDTGSTGGNTVGSAGKVKTATAGGSLNVRSGPGKTYGVLGWVKNGDSVTLVEAGDDWVKVRVERTGIVGYIRNRYIVYGSTAGSSGGTSPDYATTMTGKVTTRYANSTVTLRESPSSASAALGALSRDSLLTILGTEGNWYHVRVSENRTAYISRNYVTIVSYLATVTGGSVNLRQGNGTEYAVLAVLKKGTKVEVLEKGSQWSRVRAGDALGYLSNRYLKF